MIEFDWYCPQPNEKKFPGRVAACQALSGRVARMGGWSFCEIRAIDYRTSRVRTRGGRVSYVPADPNITARFGEDNMARDLERYKAHGHVYVMYDGGRNPSRLAHPSELLYSRHGTPNPELWDRRGDMIAFRRS